MPGPKPPVVPLAEEERHTLHTMIRAHFRAPCGTFFKITSISNRTAVATGSIGRQTRRSMRKWPM